MYGTRLLFNPDIPEVSELRNKLETSTADLSQGLSVISDSPSYSFEEDFLKATPPKSIEELKDCKDIGFYAVLATIKSVTNGPDWWYSACKCNKAVHLDSVMYYCERCYYHVVNVIPRYRIKVRVVDATESATFVVWDRDGTVLLNKSCSNLLESLKNGGGPTSHPPDFDEYLIDKEFLFKVDLRSLVSSDFGTSYNVVRVCTDERIISKFREIAGLNCRAEPDMTEGISLGDTSSSMGLQDVQSIWAKDELHQVSEHLADLSSQAENSEAQLTPHNRLFADVDENQDFDMSSTKLKQIKKEAEG